MSDTSISPGPGPDIFLLFYIKHRIEQDSELQWFEAPYCCEENPPLEWDSVKEAALLFESDNREKMNETVIQLLEPADRLNFRIFRKVSLSMINTLYGTYNKIITNTNVVL